ncbi:predicted protein [Paecilomyces variotii No. 5]|uniref:CFEM domain-containing protein n=1 Tax=Byssochlamys spectabilis (strain No. 5 / NBRC 109023) TaxID=1356009 RepID=V5I346_BYSSN|nr:predicted protein [Paecilomyces variotii No. 5]
MRFLWTVAAAAALFTTAVQADMSQLAAVLPKCGLQCMMTEIPKSSCAPTDNVCICTNPQLNEMITACVMQSCTIRESLTTKNVTSTACGAPVRDKSKAISIAGVAGGVIALIAVILRLLARLPQLGGGFGLDDVAMIVTMLLVIPLSVLAVPLANDGLGKDMWTVPFNKITDILHVYLFSEILYFSSIALTKISILFFYLRIFPKRSFRRLCYFVIGLNFSYIITFVCVAVFQCRPIKAAWLRWDGSYANSCNNINGQGWAAAVINMVFDILTMSLPLYELSQLVLSKKKKFFVMLMFSLGFFVTIVSIIRLQSLVEFATTSNVTWDYVAIGYWSTIEVHVGVVCACLPAIRSLLVHVFPSVFKGTTNAASKASMSHSGAANSRLDGKISQKPKEDESDFVPLVDMDNSSQAYLRHHDGP